MTARAILFPGQGAQAVGMGRDLAEAAPAARELFDRAHQVLGYDLAKICFEGPLETLTISAHAQPGIFVASAAMLALLRDRLGAFPFAMAAGLSSGEWTALYAAGVAGFEDTVRILDARGRFMSDACRQRAGGMLAVMGAAREQLDAVCAATGVEIANLNAREQTVLSGAKEAVDAAEAKARELGLRKVMRLNVAGAFHSALMRPAAEAFAAFLDGVALNPPAFPVVSNVTARPHEGPDAIRRRMAEQICAPVNWVGTVEWMGGQGVREYWECGPGKVLTGLVRRIDNQAAVGNIGDFPSVRAGAEKLAGAG